MYETVCNSCRRVLTNAYIQEVGLCLYNNAGAYTFILQMKKTLHHFIPSHSIASSCITRHHFTPPHTTPHYLTLASTSEHHHASYCTTSQKPAPPHTNQHLQHHSATHHTDHGATKCISNNYLKKYKNKLIHLSPHARAIKS